MSKRNHIADMLKGLGMIFVVGGHTTSPLSGYYYTFHMGLFFAISGYLMAEHWRDMKLCQYVYKKFVKIIVPYIIFFIILGIHSLITGAAGEFADYVKKMTGFKNEFIWHLMIVIVTVVLCCCIADVFILLRRTVYANFSSKIQNISRKKSVK